MALQQAKSLSASAQEFVAGNAKDKEATPEGPKSVEKELHVSPETQSGDGVARPSTASVPKDASKKRSQQRGRKNPKGAPQMQHTVPHFGANGGTPYATPEFWHPGMGPFPAGPGIPMAYPFDPHMAMQQGGVYPTGPHPMMEGGHPMLDPYGHALAVQHGYWPMHGGMPMTAGFPPGPFPPAFHPEQHMAPPVHAEHANQTLPGPVDLHKPHSQVPQPQYAPQQLPGGFHSGVPHMQGPVAGAGFPPYMAAQFSPKGARPAFTSTEFMGVPNRFGHHSRVEEFKNSDPSRKWLYKDVKGYILDFCKDKTGSMFIQKLLGDAQAQQVTAIIQEAKPHMLVLMKDAFGNYVVQKMLQRARPQERKWILNCICGEEEAPPAPPAANRVVALSKDHHSCRVIQTALQVLDMDDKKEILVRLVGDALDLVADQNGNHVIQKCIECIKPASALTPLVSALLSGKTSQPARGPQGQIIQVKGEIIALCQNMYGCRVMQRLLDFGDKATRDTLLSAVLENVVERSKNTYSNYVVQHILERGPQDAKDAVWQQLSPHIFELSSNKCASNVVEKCFSVGESAKIHAWVDHLLSDTEKLIPLMADRFGNYVCFTAFVNATDSQRARMAEVLQWNCDFLRLSTYGKNFLTKLVNSPESRGYFAADDLLVSQAETAQFKAASKEGTPTTSASGPFQPLTRVRPEQGDWLAIPAAELDPTPLRQTVDEDAWAPNPPLDPAGPGNWLAIPADELEARLPLAAAAPTPPARKTMSADAEPVSEDGASVEAGARKRQHTRRRGKADARPEGKLGQAKSEGDLLGDRPCQVSLTADGTLVNLVPAI